MKSGARLNLLGRTLTLIAGSEGSVGNSNNLWQPITDEYKAKTAQPNSEAAEFHDKLQTLKQANVKAEQAAEKKPPLGITAFTWFSFLRAGFYGLLFFFLLMFPHSGPANWLGGTVDRLLHGQSQAESQSAARLKLEESQAAANGYGMESAPDESQGKPVDLSAAAVNLATIYLGVAMILNVWLGFRWLVRDWRIRWVTMFYAGAFVAKVGIGIFAGSASGVGSPIPAGQSLTTGFSLALNSLIFLYLAFWPGIQDMFEGRA